VKKWLIPLMLVIATASVAFVATTSPVQRLGPGFTSSEAFDSLTGGQVGGEMRLYLADDTLRVGQVVYIKSRNKVAASATLANYNAIAGIVVGGARTSMQMAKRIADTSTVAATANQRVWVLNRGRFWVLIDTVTAGIAAGKQLVPSAIAGRVTVKTINVDTFSRIFGKMVDTGIINKAALANINVRP
jgi:hypothetical protein